MQLTGYTSIIGDRKPTFIDTTSTTIIYEGYEAGQDFIICKINISTSIITRAWATGSWDVREFLIYT